MGAPYRGELLIVDDMPDNLRLLSKLLREHGYKVRPARNGPQALAAVDGSVPDLVLLDINMPGMDGYEVCRRLKSTEHAADLPILFLTAMDSVEHKIRGFQAGGVDYITKPFQQEEVLLRVETHLTLRSQRQQLEAQYTRLRQLEEMREGLVQMIAHDIKAPLQSILGFSQLLVRLGKSVEDPRVGRYGRIIDNGSRTVLDMVQAMLDVSRLEEGQMPLEVSDFELNPLVSDVHEGLEGLLSSRHVTLNTALQRVPPLRLRGDAELVRRIVVNILSNAIRFSPKGGVVRLDAAAERTGWIRVTVSDQGPGVPEAHQAHIFRKFGEVEARASRQKYSTGLGLAFCRMAVEAHGGTIGVRNAEEGTGAVFWFDLPTVVVDS